MNNREVTLCMNLASYLTNACLDKTRKSWARSEQRTLTRIHSDIILADKEVFEKFRNALVKPTIELVDSHHGVYAMRILAEQYVLAYKRGNIFMCKAVADAVVEFDPDKNPDWVETELENYYVMQCDGSFWRCEWRDGDIIAVNPRAVWNEEGEYYELPENGEPPKILGVSSEREMQLRNTCTQLVDEVARLIDMVNDLKSEADNFYVPEYEGEVVKQAKKLLQEMEVK